MHAVINQDDFLQKTFKFELGADAQMLAEGEYFMCESCYEEYEPEDVVTMPDCCH